MTDRDCLTLIVPPKAVYVRTVRLAVGGLASVVGFDVEAIDDLRIAVDELWSVLLDLGQGEITLLATVGDQHLGVRGNAAAEAHPADVESDRLEFSRAILSVVADQYELTIIDGIVTCSFERSVDDLGEAKLEAADR